MWWMLGIPIGVIVVVGLAIWIGLRGWTPEKDYEVQIHG